MIRKGLYTSLWAPMAAVTLVIAAVGSLFIGMAAVMIPAVRWLATQADGED